MLKNFFISVSIIIGLCLINMALSSTPSVQLAKAIFTAATSGNPLP